MFGRQQYDAGCFLETHPLSCFKDDGPCNKGVLNDQTLLKNHSSPRLLKTIWDIPPLPPHQFFEYFILLLSGLHGS